MDPVRTILEEAGLSEKHWPFAVEHVIYIKNRLPYSDLGCTPIENLTSLKASIAHLCVFGCAAFVHNQRPKSKVRAKGIPAIYLGGNDNSVYIVGCIPDRKVIRSVHVTFDESFFPRFRTPTQVQVVRKVTLRLTTLVTPPSTLPTTRCLQNPKYPPSLLPTNGDMGEIQEQMGTPESEAALKTTTTTLLTQLTSTWLNTHKN